MSNRDTPMKANRLLLDWTRYGGSNVGNAGGLPSEPIPWQGQPHSILLTAPLLAVVFFKPDREGG